MLGLALIPAPMSSETTLILFKPDAVSKNITGEVLSRFQAEGFLIRGIKMMLLSDEILAEHYSHIADKPFFPSVRGFMQETPVIALALEGEDVITRVRDLLGPTDSMVAAAGTIRGDFTVDSYGHSALQNRAVRNLIHQSGSPEEADYEIGVWFKADEIINYKTVQERILYDVDLNGILD